MLSDKDLVSWEIAKDVIVNSKKPKNSCDSHFNYSEFLVHSEYYYNKNYAGHADRKESLYMEIEESKLRNLSPKDAQKYAEEHKFDKEKK